MKETKKGPRERGRKHPQAAILALVCSLSLPVSVALGAERANVVPGPKDKCPVCGMLVAPFPNWWTAVVFTDGTRVFFDGPRDMFKYFLDLKRYSPSRRSGDVAAVYVTDYYRALQIDGKKARYVTGSDVNGPMGAELVPLEEEADARAFVKDHKGKRVLTFESITLDALTGRESGRDQHRHE